MTRMDWDRVARENRTEAQDRREARPERPKASDPVEIRSRYRSTCGLCGRAVRKGAVCYWVRKEHAVAHPECWSSEREPLKALRAKIADRRQRDHLRRRHGAKTRNDQRKERIDLQKLSRLGPEEAIAYVKRQMDHAVKPKRGEHRLDVIGTTTRTGKGAADRGA